MRAENRDSNVHGPFAGWFQLVADCQTSFMDELMGHFVKPDAERGLVEMSTEYLRGLFDGVASNPVRLAEQQVEYWCDQVGLYQRVLLKMLGEPVEPLIAPAPGDRRFSDPAWSEHALFDFIKQNYLLLAKHLSAATENLEGLSDRRRRRIEYFTRQYVNALAPTNFPTTNPDVLRKMRESNGASLLTGLRLLLEDRERSAGVLNVCMSRPDGFELGKDLACTPGSVVFENDLMQLIQYAPATEQVYRTPILIVPSWVNKYYVLDLSPENSYIRWLVEQGYTVFAISWINPDASHREFGFADYMALGPLSALAEIERLTGEREVAAVGYCLGGILLACARAYAEAGGERRFAAATYLAVSMDFSEPGDMGIFVDENSVAEIEKEMAERGYFDGRLLAAGFSLLRENDLYWSYYVTNYLKGERPSALDVMHWNSDSTHLTAACHGFVLRELHLFNRLIRPNGITLNGRGIDLGGITSPTYILGTEKDHIAEWRSTYTAALLQRGENRFVLAGAGHIAGVVNPPQANKYHFFVNDELAADAERWLAGANKLPGSWWLDWHQWQRRTAGPLVAARTIDSDNVIEPAPGRYVRRRITDPADLESVSA